jgi:hypothetical protein
MFTCAGIAKPKEKSANIIFDERLTIRESANAVMLAKKSVIVTDVDVMKTLFLKLIKISLVSNKVR